MICPTCKKGELKEQITIVGFIFKKKKVYTYCNVCDFTNKKEFKLSREDIEVERDKRASENEIELQRAKNIKENKNINETKYDQKYERI